MKEIKSEKAPKAIGPYSQAIMTSGGTLYISGQLGLDRETLELKKDIKEQTKTSLENILNILISSKLDKSNIVKTTILLKDLKDFDDVNKIYQTFFEGLTFPARSCYQVAKLPKDALIEIEVVATI